MRTLVVPTGHRTLIDTSAYFALVDVDDINHMRADAAITSTRGRLYTTNFILAETHALLLRRLGREIAAQFINEAGRDRTNLIRVRADDEKRALEIILTHNDKDYTLTNATSFAVMERLHIGTAFTFDRHFAQFGFAVLGPGDP